LNLQQPRMPESTCCSFRRASVSGGLAEHRNAA
jgi:hypothetical protein